VSPSTISLDLQGQISARFIVSTFKVASWGPIALKGVPQGRGLAADALAAELIMQYGGGMVRHHAC
jgi:hypothetical protein